MTSPYATPLQGDCLEVMAGMPAESVDAIGVDNDPASVAIARRRLEDRRATTPLFA